MTLQYVVSDEARFLKKIFRGPNLGPTCLNQAQVEVFRYFLEFGLLFFLGIAYSDSLQQYLTSGREVKKILGAQIWVKRAKIGPNVMVFAIF